jgi:protein-S-isoprenylcysteine O-methyltransferase Ste14/uncharacterized membrane protein (UPF0127 family)
MDVTVRVENGRIVCERCVLADTALARMRGLLGRRELPSGEGILLRPASSVHTAFMRFAIDAVFVDRENRILKVVPNLAPWRTAAARRAKAVIELPAGESERRGLSAGQRVLEEPTAALATEARAASMQRTRRRNRIALNVVLATVYLIFAVANLASWRSTGRPVGLGIMALELMVATLFFLRRDPWVTSSAPLAWVSTSIGTFGMLAARPGHAPVFGLGPVYVGLQLVGAAAAAYSLGALGRSFGLVAANRGIRTAGPYRLVRHPLYVSYFVTYVGYVLENPTPWNAALLLTVITFQVVRIGTEETCLRTDPEYARYCDRVRYRLIPHLW